MRRAFFGVVGLVVLLGVAGALLLQVPAVQDRVLAQVVARAVRSTADDLLADDAMRVLVCGSASPLPHPTRARPCVAVFAGGRMWIVDTGPGSWNTLALRRVPGESIGAVLYTHFHSDHIGELGEFNLQTWVAGRPGPLQVFGPPGVDRVVSGFAAAYALDTTYRITHHGPELMRERASRMRSHTIDPASHTPPREVVLVDGDLTITAFPVDHAPVSPAVGYRFDIRGRSVVVSGDTVPDPRLVDAARGADVLLHEAQANHMVAAIGSAAKAAGRDRIAKIMGDIPDYHTTPVEAAQVANEAGVGLLVFTHLTPPPPNRIAETIFLRGVADVRPDGWVLGNDGTLIVLPFDSEAIEVGFLD